MNLFSGLEKFGLEAKESMQMFEEGLSGMGLKLDFQFCRGAVGWGE